MKVWLVTSRITFVPENYTHIVKACAKSEYFAGLIVLDNFSWSWVAKGLALILTGAAPRLGFHLIKNTLDASWKKKIHYFAKAQKKHLVLSSLNSKEAIDIIKDEAPDLLINARTRLIYKEAILNTPKLGCWNIHHGLLPKQKGLMCDFWARQENLETGFSIHHMTAKIDAGEILTTRAVPTHEKNYLKTALLTEQLEIQELHQLLKQFSEGEDLPSQPNLANNGIAHFKNPGLIDFWKARLRGLKI